MIAVLTNCDGDGMATCPVCKCDFASDCTACLGEGFVACTGCDACAERDEEPEAESP